LRCNWNATIVVVAEWSLGCTATVIVKVALVKTYREPPTKV